MFVVTLDDRGVPPSLRPCTRVLRRGSSRSPTSSVASSTARRSMHDRSQVAARQAAITDARRCGRSCPRESRPRRRGRRTRSIGSPRAGAIRTCRSSSGPPCPLMTNLDGHGAEPMVIESTRAPCRPPGAGCFVDVGLDFAARARASSPRRSPARAWMTMPSRPRAPPRNASLRPMPQGGSRRSDACECPSTTPSAARAPLQSRPQSRSGRSAMPSTT